MHELPNLAAKRSASACLRTLPKTWYPSANSTSTKPHPIPVDTPVTSTSGLLFMLVTLSRAGCLEKLHRIIRADNTVVTDKKLLARRVHATPTLPYWNFGLAGDLCHSARGVLCL